MYCMYIITTGIIDVGAEWASDLKEGICPGSFYFDLDSCCWLSNETVPDNGSCSKWKTWAELYGVKRAADVYVLNYFIYITLAVVFGGMAGLFVTRLAPYASGSGIPEVYVYCLLANYYTNYSAVCLTFNRFTEN